MGPLMKGDVIVATFLFSDLKSSKKRPALVLASFPKDRVILCQITSQGATDAYSVSVTATDFKAGGI